MSETAEPTEAAEILKNAGGMRDEDAAAVAAEAQAQFRLSDAETPQFPVDLRALIRQRSETKLRRIHKQWFCFDPNIQAEVDQALAELAELTGAEIQKQQLNQQPSRKYNLPSPIRAAQARYDDAKAKARQVGAIGVFQNLTDDEFTAAQKHDTTFDKARAVLLVSFLRWEDADGNTLPDEVLGQEDLEALLEPEVLERGEWLPLASTIVNESASVVDRPTSRPA
jgi:hypothetical protein